MAACRLLHDYTFANNFNQITPGLTQIFLTLMLFLKEIFENINFEKKISRQQKSMQNYSECKKLIDMKFK